MALGARWEDWCCYVQIAEEETGQLSVTGQSNPCGTQGWHCATGAGQGRPRPCHGEAPADSRDRVWTEGTPGDESPLKPGGGSESFFLSRE